MEKCKALVITEVIKEPRTFEITSPQMRFMEQEQQFELDVKDIEGEGTFYPILTHSSASKKAIEHALHHHAKWEYVWVLKELPMLRKFQLACAKRMELNPEETLLKQTLIEFFDTCNHYCFVGDCKEVSYRDMHIYDTCTAIFSCKDDAVLFKQLMLVFESDVTYNRKEKCIYSLLDKRVPTQFPSRYEWEHM